MKGFVNSFFGFFWGGGIVIYENAVECPALWAGMNAAIPKNR